MFLLLPIAKSSSCKNFRLVIKAPIPLIIVLSEPRKLESSSSSNMVLLIAEISGQPPEIFFEILIVPPKSLHLCAVLIIGLHHMSIKIDEACFALGLSEQVDPSTQNRDLMLVISNVMIM